MTNEITIMGGEPYAEWIKRDDNAQRLYKAYRDKWPDGDAQCVVIGREFYVRYSNGDGMRRVYNEGDFDDEDEWCAQCGTPIDPDSGEYYRCDVYDCDAVLCEYCGGSMTGNYYCPAHRGNELLADSMEPEYTYPYAFAGGHQFTFGVEIEIESELSDDFAESVTGSDIIAGWDSDASLEHNGVELQSNILVQTTRLETDCGGYFRVWRERWRAYPRGAHAKPVCEPLVLGVAWAGRGTVSSTRHAPP